MYYISLLHISTGKFSYFMLNKYGANKLTQELLFFFLLFNELLFRFLKILFCLNEILLRLNEILLRLNEVLFPLNELLFRFFRINISS